MTTIAYKDGVLAFDSRVTDGSYIVGACVKGKRLKSGSLLAYAGDLAQGQLFLAWAESGFINNDAKKALESIKTPAFMCVHIDTHGNISEFLDAIIPTKYKSKMYAWGSGAQFALGCMHFGGTAVQGVQAAKALDAATGGRIRTLTLEGVCQKKPQRRSKS